MSKDKTLSKKAMVYFVGAGPGDPDLITVRGRRRIAEADLVLYAGSLVPEKLLQYAPEHAVIYNSVGLKLEKQIEIMSEAVKSGSCVVRLHTGDPSIFGAIAEQMKALDRLDIPYVVVPGVSSALAAAAALKIELTVPEITQTVILTRLSGRTEVPERESLAGLAAHHSSLMIFLSVGMINRVVEELRSAGYADDTPVAVVYRVTWPDEKIIRGSLKDIAGKVLEDEITHHALIVVSPSLKNAPFDVFPVSHLYGEGQDAFTRDHRTAIVTLTRNGLETGRKLLEGLPQSVLYAPERFLEEGSRDDRIQPTAVSIRQTLQTAFKQHRALICILASGIVVRELAPLMVSKHVDPAVVIVDEAGKFAFSLLSGHKGGANALARRCADVLGGQAVVTTASDVRGLPALDLLAERYGWAMIPAPSMTALSSAMVNDEPFGVYQDCGTKAWLPVPVPWHFTVFDNLGDLLADEVENAICITYKDLPLRPEKANKNMLVLHPACLHVGVGCNRGAPASEIKAAVTDTFARFGLALESIASIATIDIKQDEEGLLTMCKNQQWSLRAFSAEELAAVGNIPNPSASVRGYVGVSGVAEPAAMLAAQKGVWLVEKQKFPSVTVAVALEETV